MENDDEVVRVIDNRLIEFPVAPQDASPVVHKKAAKLVVEAEELSRRRDGSIDEQETLCILRRALKKVDPAYKRALEGSLMLDALAANISRQGKGETQRKLKRAVVEQIAHGHGGTTFSVGAVKRRMGFWAGIADETDIGGRLGKRGEAPPSVEGAMAKRRKQRSDRLHVTVDRAVAEFAYCYCKFTENKFVCLLTKVHLWALYCVYHDRDGGYFPCGKVSRGCFSAGVTLH